MLVLRRKVDEALVIDGVITVTVLAVEGERVKIGIQAPPDVLVVRGELLTTEGQHQALRKKQDALTQETDPTRRQRLAAAIARLQQVLAPTSVQARQE
jgi:carbon storage regulator